MACTKTTIIEKVAKKNGLSPSQAKDTIETLLEIMKETLSSGEDIMVTGFGKFEVNGKSQRKGRNPAKGEPMILPARRVVTFRLSGKLRDKINGGNKKGQK